MKVNVQNADSIDIQGISRVTGYLSLDERFGAGKYQERADRSSHTGQQYEIIMVLYKYISIKEH